MSTPSYADMDTDALIEEFARLAKATHSALRLVPNVTRELLVRNPLMKELLAVGAELRVRKPIEKLRRLFEHESAEVRTTAGAQFLALDEKWALAAISSSGAGLPTREVVALCDRARRGPPARPTVKEMTVEQLAARFEDAGMRRYAAVEFMGGESEAWDVELANRTAGEMLEVADELKSRDAVSALLPLLNHSNVYVRTLAAMRCLPIAPDLAVPVLEAVKAGPNRPEAMNAGSALNRWRKQSEQARAP
jgi:HEAT repeat protein